MIPFVFLITFTLIHLYLITLIFIIGLLKKVVKTVAELHVIVGVVKGNLQTVYDRQYHHVVHHHRRRRLARVEQVPQQEFLSLGQNGLLESEHQLELIQLRQRILLQIQIQRELSSQRMEQQSKKQFTPPDYLFLNL